MDPLSDAFTALHVASVLYGRLEARSPWGVAFPASDHVGFGTVARGNCWLVVEGTPEPVALTGGDCFLLAGERAYALKDHPASRTRDIGTLCQDAQRMEVGGSGAPASVVVGCFTLDQAGRRPLSGLLPPLVHLGAERARTLSLHATLELLAAESAAADAGSRIVINRLADVLFIQMLRAHAAEPGCSGWLRALSDRQLGAALRAMHASLEQNWTVESLAAAAAMSRSAFAARFKAVVGEPPLEYLTRWRMLHAGRWLREDDAKLIAIANRAGYDSEAAFSRAFKRVLGVAPGQFRRAPLPSGPGAAQVSG